MPLPGQKLDALREGLLTVDVDPRMAVGEVGATLRDEGTPRSIS